MKKAAFVFCTDLSKDPVAAHVFAALRRLLPLADTGIYLDSHPVLEWKDGSQGHFFFVSTDDVISHDYTRYAEQLNEQFADVDLLGVVNWHQGANAPNSIFTVQTTGDMGAGRFSPVDPRLTRSLLLAIEDERIKADLVEFQSFMEATHWSGVLYGHHGEQLSNLTPSTIDIEIGSSSNDWNNPIAAEVLARALPRAFERADEQIYSLLCVGGIHFEPSFTRAVLDSPSCRAFAVSHILPNQWLVSEGYDREERLKDLHACVRSIRGGIDAIVHHDRLKSAYKIQAQGLAKHLQVPLLSHKRLRDLNSFAGPIASNLTQ